MYRNIYIYIYIYKRVPSLGSEWAHNRVVLRDIVGVVSLCIFFCWSCKVPATQYSSYWSMVAWKFIYKKKKKIIFMRFKWKKKWEIGKMGFWEIGKWEMEMGDYRWKIGRGGSLLFVSVSVSLCTSTSKTLWLWDGDFFLGFLGLNAPFWFMWIHGLGYLGSIFSFYF